MGAAWQALPQTIPEEEQMELFRQMAAGNTEARNRLIEVNMRLSSYMAGHFLNIGLPREDLIGIANIALIKAVDTFNIEKGYKFATYATLCMRNEILMQERKEKRFRRVLRLDAIAVDNDKGGEPMTFEEFIGAEDPRMDVYVDREGAQAILDAAVKKAKTKTEKLQLKAAKLVYIDGVKQNKGGEILGISQSYFSRLVRHGVSRLKRVGRSLDVAGDTPRRIPLEENANKINIIKLLEVRKELEIMRGKPVHLNHGMLRWLLESTALKVAQVAEMVKTHPNNIYRFKKRLEEGKITEPADPEAVALYNAYVDTLPSFEKVRLSKREQARKQAQHEAPSELVTYTLLKEEKEPPEPAPVPLAEVAATEELEVPEFSIIPPEVTNTPAMSLSLDLATVDNIADFMEIFMLQLSKDKKYNFQVSVTPA